MNLRIVSLEPALKEAWDEVCKCSREAWFWHTSRWLDYTCAYNPALQSRSCSFLVYEGSTPLAAAPLLLEEHKLSGRCMLEFSFGGGSLPEPACVDGLSTRQREEVHRVIFERISALARAHQVGRIRMRSNPIASLDSRPGDKIPPAMRFGFASYLLWTQILDVRVSPEDLIKGMRKGHRSDIRRGQRTLKGFVVSEDAPSAELFSSYRELHQKAARRKTRPSETFDMMFRWIEDGYGALFGAELEGNPVSFAYVNLYKGSAYYASACNDPEAQHLPLAHFVQWQILKWLNTHGFRFYEIGWQFYASTEVLPASDKELSISRFKRGFGGNAVPIIFSERFFSQRDYLDVSQDRMERFARTILQSRDDHAVMGQG